MGRGYLGSLIGVFGLLVQRRGLRAVVDRQAQRVSTTVVGCRLVKQPACTETFGTQTKIHLSTGCSLRSGSTNEVVYKEQATEATMNNANENS